MPSSPLLWLLEHILENGSRPLNPTMHALINGQTLESGCTLTESSPRRGGRGEPCTACHTPALHAMVAVGSRSGGGTLE